MNREVRPVSSLKKTLRVPPDKSLSHRALILSTLARGTSVFTNILESGDVRSTLRCLRALGADITAEGPGRYRTGGSGPESLTEPADVLDAGNSGTTMRLLCGLLAGRPFFSVLTGDESLRGRPMARIVTPLELMGARIDGRGGGRFAPLAVKGGALKGIDHATQVASAQVKSAILIAGLQAKGTTRVREPGQSRDHTERMLRAMGADIRVGEGAASVKGGCVLRPLKASIPGDISSAAFFLVAGLILPDAKIRIKDVLLNPTRTGVLDILRGMGGCITLENEHESDLGEPVGDVIAESSVLRGIEIPPDLVPRAVDEFPVIAVAAAVAQGVTTVRGAGELRHKESDRIAAIVAGLSAMDAEIEELPDGFRVQGGGTLKGAALSSRGDHRIAMALAVAALTARGASVVEEAECTDISFPGFWEILES
jgi:3-phosphoshikimate 1-carboxyvinyltransferase